MHGCGDSERPRKVGALLIIGILFFPFIFAWALLRSGYSKKVRAVGLGWMMIYVLALTVDRNAGQPEQPISATPPVPIASTSIKQPADEGETPVKPQIMEVTALALSAAFEANEVAALKTYENKILVVTGTVDRIELDLMDEPVIMLRGTNPVLGVRASLDKRQSDRAAAIRKGAGIRVVCNRVREVLSTPMLDTCELS